MLQFFWFLVALGPRCCMQVFSSCSKLGLLFTAVHRLLIAASWGYSSLQYTSFSLQWLLLLQSTGSRVRGLQELRFLGPRAQA